LGVIIYQQHAGRRFNRENGREACATFLVRNSGYRYDFPPPFYKRRALDDYGYSILSTVLGALEDVAL